MNQRGTAGIIVGVLVLLTVGGVGYYALVSRPLPPVAPATSSGPAPTASGAPMLTLATPTATTADWPEYRDATHGYVIRYPPEWRPAPCGNDCVNFGPNDQPDVAAALITVVASSLAEAQAALPIVRNPDNEVTSQAAVTIGSVNWTRLTIRQQVSDLMFLEFLTERDRRTYVVGFSTDDPVVARRVAEMLETFTFGATAATR